MADTQELLDCSICLQLLEDPVTTACGHSYCMKCINAFWDKNYYRGKCYSCPQCRRTFCLRPELNRNTLLADLLEQHRRNFSQNADDDDSYARLDDVPCDACKEKKRKAFKFCLVCLAAYCETHLQPHFEVPPLQKHSLIPASAWIKESICGCHDKLLEIYCRTDQQFICLMCVMDQHKGHDTVAVSAEKCELQKRLKRTQQEIADRTVHSNTQMAKLSDAADAIKNAAWEACDDFERLCAQHIRIYVRSMERKCSEVREKIGEEEKASVDWNNSCLGKLKQEVSELRRMEKKIDQLLLTEDPFQFLKGFQALGELPAFTDQHKKLDTLAEFVTAQKEKFKKMCKKERNELMVYSEKNLLTRVSTFHELPEKVISRSLAYSKLKVDPCTVAACLSLSKNNREILWGDIDQDHPDLPDRFTYYHQALCKQGLNDKHWWEVEWDGGIIEVAVSYIGIKRKGSGRECCFGHNNLSWKLTCSPSGCTFWHNNLHKGQIPPVRSRRLCIYLDYKAGQLRFYSVFNSLTLLHHIQTTFTEPLYPGFSVDLGATLKICH